jgi:hypothetical protein
MPELEFLIFGILLLLVRERFKPGEWGGEFSVI